MADIFAKDVLAGKRILVTGGGTGLGLAIAERAAGLSAQVVICGRREAVLQEAAAGIQTRTGATVTAITCDVREPDQVTAMIDKIWADGPLDVLVNNAAGAILGRAETLSMRAYEAVFRVTLNGVVACSLEVGRRWIAESRGGVILTTIASGADRGQPYTSPLTTAKGAVLSFMRGLAMEWGPLGIRCLGIGPGKIATEGGKARLGAGRAGNAVERVPLRRYGEPAEVADLAVFLMSDAAGFITGEMVTIDGGRSLVAQETLDMFGWTAAQWDALRPKK